MKTRYHDTSLKVWVLDVESGKAKAVGSDPWMVPQRTLAPVWSPDSKRVAYASRLESLYRAIVVTNVGTGDTQQGTDGLADAMYPAFDASGKYLLPESDEERGAAGATPGPGKPPSRSGRPASAGQVGLGARSCACDTPRAASDRATGVSVSLEAGPQRVAGHGHGRALPGTEPLCL